MKTEDLSVEQMQAALTSFREWAKRIVVALGDEPKFDYDFDAVPGRIEDLRSQLAAARPVTRDEVPGTSS
jgi:hypothetical protein